MDTSADAYFPDPRPLPPGQRRQLWARLAIRLGIFLSLVLFLCLAGRPLLSLCMPFALALLATWLTEPLLRFFHRRWNIPRGIGAIVLTLLRFDNISFCNVPCMVFSNEAGKIKCICP